VVDGSCDTANCTAAATGICILSKPAPADCPHFHARGVPPPVGVVESEAASVGFEPEAEQPQRARTFHLGNELGSEDAVEVMRARYTHLVAVLGFSNAGKTCFLSSLYLMASAGILPSPYQFAGSLTLQAFEDRARGLRDWPKEGLPDQLVDHTSLPDKRQPSLLHLAIRETSMKRRRFDLLLTDIPGEWTDHLALRATGADSFRFLHRADGIILVVDGNRLRSDDRHAELQRLRYVAERIANDVQADRGTPFVVLVSKADEIGMQMPAAAEELRNHIHSLGFPATATLCAAFSRTPNVTENGTGVFDAIGTILEHPSRRYSRVEGAANDADIARTFQTFRG